MREAEQVESGRAHGSLRMQLAEVEAELERQRGRVKQLEGELLTQTLAKEGLERDMEKEQQFHQRLSKALKFDSTTAQVVTGDFARDAILVRAEQMTKHDVRYNNSALLNLYCCLRLRLWLRSSRHSTRSNAS